MKRHVLIVASTLLLLLAMVLLTLWSSSNSKVEKIATHPVSGSPAAATRPAPDPLLKALEAKLRETFKDLVPTPTFDYTREGSSLEVHYKIRKFMVHSASMTGDYSEEAHETIGPSSRGFILTVYVENEGESNQAITPQTLVEPYWKRDLDLTVIKKAGKQLFWGVAYGPRVDRKVLSEVRAIVTGMHDLGSRSSFGPDGKTPEVGPHGVSGGQRDGAAGGVGQAGD